MRQLNHSEFYNVLNKEEQLRYLDEVRESIESGDLSCSLFQEMLNKVNKHVRNYQSDFLLHDINAFTIERNDCDRFIWNHYESGTRLVRMDAHFEEEKQSHYEQYEVLKNNHYLSNGNNYIINLKNKSITKIKNIDNINITDFSAANGKVNDYFNEKTKGLFFTKELISDFENLKREYNNHPPKRLVDQIIEEHQKKKQFV